MTLLTSAEKTLLDERGCNLGSHTLRPILLGSRVQYLDDDGSLRMGATAAHALTQSAILIGAQANVTASGFPLSSSLTRAVGVFSEDDGESIGGSVRGVQSRLLLTVDQSGGSIRALQGQLKLANGVDLTSGIYTALQGYVEMMGTHSAKTGSTFSGVDVSAEIGTALTIDSGGEFFGLHVETTGAGTITNNGTCAAIGITKASNAAKWPFAMYVPGTDVEEGIRIGTSASAAGSGVTLSATHSAVVSLFGDDGGAAISSGTLTRIIRARLLQTYTAGNREQESAAIIGQLVSKSGTNRHNMCGLMGSYEVNTGLTVGGQVYTTDSWIQAAVIGRVGAGSAITTIDTYGVLAGVAAMSNTTSFAANSGKFVGFYAGRWGGTSLQRWNYGLYAEDVEQAAYYNVNAGTVTGEKHGWDLVNTGTLSSGDSLVGVNVLTTAAGTAASWVSGLYVKATQPSKMVNGYICAAEFELASTAANASDHAGVVINMTNNHTGSVPQSPYIMIRDYGTTHADQFLAIGPSTGADTGQGGTTSQTTVYSTAGAGFEANCDCVVKCSFGGVPFWLLGSTTGPS